jgi:rhomboid family GlyGly-CTERM serine protease
MSTAEPAAVAIAGVAGSGGQQGALGHSGRAWLLLSAVLMVGSVAAWPLPRAWLDWQPELAFSQPWRLWTAVWVHWSPLHLGANLLAAAVVAAFGATARVPGRLAAAWCVAWPLTHLGLCWVPALTHYGGLSGVLHGGISITVLWLLFDGRGARRAIGAAIFVGLVIKIVTEHPLAAPTHVGDGWDIAVAPVAHLSGALAGALCAAPVLLALAWRRQAGSAGV